MKFEEDVRSRGPALVRLAWLLAHDQHAGDDLAQEVGGKPAYVSETGRGKDLQVTVDIQFPDHVVTIAAGPREPDGVARFDRQGTKALPRVPRSARRRSRHLADRSSWLTGAAG